MSLTTPSKQKQIKLKRNIFFYFYTHKHILFPVQGKYFLSHIFPYFKDYKKRDFNFYMLKCCKVLCKTNAEFTEFDNKKVCSSETEVESRSSVREKSDSCSSVFRELHANIQELNVYGCPREPLLIFTI